MIRVPHWTRFFNQSTVTSLGWSASHQLSSVWANETDFYFHHTDLWNQHYLFLFLENNDSVACVLLIAIIRLLICFKLLYFSFLTPMYASIAWVAVSSTEKGCEKLNWAESLGHSFWLQTLSDSLFFFLHNHRLDTSWLSARAHLWSGHTENCTVLMCDSLCSGLTARVTLLFFRSHWGTHLVPLSLPS